MSNNLQLTSEVSGNNKYKIKDIFYVTSGVRITLEDIYNHSGALPCITSQTMKGGIAWYGDEEWLGKIYKKGKPVIVDQPCITWTKEGNAGKMFVRNYKFYPIDVCGVLIPKGNVPIDLNWFVYNFQNYIYTKVTSKGGQGKLYEEQMKNIAVEIPDIKIQEIAFKAYEKRATIKKIINQIKKDINKQFRHNVSYEGEEYKIKDVFHVTSGVRITLEDIYAHPGSMPCVTSQTTNRGIAWYGDEFWLNGIRKNGKKVVVDQPCITWTKDGVKAGTMFVRDERFYPNDHCGVLIPKGNVKISREWFVYTFQNYIFSKVVAQGNQGMLYEEQIKNVKVIIPDISIQNYVAEQYKKMNSLLQALSR